ncbi:MULTISPECIES: dipeptide ABC transporter ATP-binding protein [Metasolibacillus]|uniref:ABC transporter ATP-binding protein n=1 Tax=Metasolibacillus TaxID=2703677 RepID=UPI0007962AF8|nr:dipeptide ABC transporter ATP-binding protein [Metasolibacillus fluoroglycofenilyticus]KYG91276.1 hypothetical protein A0U40_15040 [[Bacillus] sp. KCTC 13219]
MDKIVEVKNIQKHYPVTRSLFRRSKQYVKAVDNVSFNLYRGETLGIVGESGCGKSTLGRTILQLIEPTSGQVYFNGKDITKLKFQEMKSIRKQFQMIFQDPYASLNSRKTIYQIVSEPLKLHGLYNTESKEQVYEMLEKVGLSRKVAQRYPHEFSGGQRQRIGIARALILKPDVIIADEPVSALDVSVQAQVLNLLQDLQEELGLTYIFISHDLSVVKHISNRVAVMYLGKIVEIADKKMLYANPSHPYTKALLSVIPSIHPKTGEVEELKGELPNPENPPIGCAFHTRCPSCMEICKEKQPQFVTLQDGHEVACHLYKM